MANISLRAWADRLGVSHARAKQWHQDGRLPTRYEVVEGHGPRPVLALPEDTPRPEPMPPGRPARPREDRPKRPRGRPRQSPVPS